ncbi:MAG: ArsR/SmtB family transcription factor [Thermoanaerobaculia bacterium]
MVNNIPALDSTFGALADPTRRAILARLSESPEASVSQLAEPFAMSLPAISKHLKVLEGAGLIGRRRQGRVHHLRLLPAPLDAATEWIARYRKFWEEKLDALDRYLKEPRKEEDRPWPPHPRRPRRRSGSRARTPRPARRSSGPGPNRKR